MLFLIYDLNIIVEVLLDGNLPIFSYYLWNNTLFPVFMLEYMNHWRETEDFLVFFVEILEIHKFPSAKAWYQDNPLNPSKEWQQFRADINFTPTKSPRGRLRNNLIKNISNNVIHLSQTEDFLMIITFVMYWHLISVDKFNLNPSINLFQVTGPSGRGQRAG